jgi:hypothetical protein
MFNFSIYNSWIKKQIFDPLSEIYNLLEKNLEILTDTNRALEKQISENVDVSIQVALTLQKKRLDLRIEDIKKFMALIKVYMSKIN